MTENLLSKRKTIIDSSWIDASTRLKPSGLINLLIQAAIDSADQLGFGFKDLEPQQLVWVLSRLNIEIYEPLHWYDEAEVETWPKNIERLFYMRDFVVKNQHGKIVASATSAWLAIDSKSRRPKQLKEEHIEKFTRLKDKHALAATPGKLKATCGVSTMQISPNYYDIDLNNHVTAVRYIDWMMDSFPLAYHRSNYPKQLCVNYLKETLFNETLEIFKEEDKDSFHFEGLNKTQDCSAFRGKISF